MLQELMNPENGYFWMLLGLSLLALEALGVPGFFLGTLGVAAILTGLPAFLLPIPIVWLLVSFGVLSIAAFFFARPIVVRYFMGGKEHHSNVAGMVGKVAIVTQSIGGRHQPGYIKLAGDEWRALPVDGTAYPEGTEVEIQRLEGATVYVGPHNTNENSEVNE